MRPLLKEATRILKESGEIEAEEERRRKRLQIKHLEDRTETTSDDNDDFEAGPSRKKIKIGDNEATEAESNANAKPVLRRSTRLSGGSKPKDSSTVAAFTTPKSFSKSESKINDGIVVQYKGPRRYLKDVARLKARQAPPPHRDLATLLTLPRLVHQKLLLYLDVESMESLSKTCSVFDWLINGQYLTSINIPHDPSFHFLKEIRETGSLEVKPLLKLKCDKSWQTSHIIKDCSKHLLSYTVASQMSMLETSKLREIDLVQDKVEISPNWFGNGDNCFEIDNTIICELVRSKSLNHVSRLSLVVKHSLWNNQYFNWLYEFLQNHLPSLQVLHLYLTSKTGMRYDFLPLI